MSASAATKTRSHSSIRLAGRRSGIRPFQKDKVQDLLRKYEGIFKEPWQKAAVWETFKSSDMQFGLNDRQQ